VSFVGVYAVHATTFDLVLMVGLGIVGWALRKLGFPMAPLILGFVLGDMMEQNLRRALAISDGHPGILFTSPVTWVLWALAAGALAMPLLLRRLKPAG
jgi:putative tricarboxylic transport membrane protein